VTAKDALANLLEQSSRVEAAVIFDRSGKVAGSTLSDADRSKRLAASALQLLEEAERRRPQKAGDQPLAQLEVAIPAGSAFVVQDDDRLIAATTGPEPTVGLVFYDLKKALRDLAAEKPKPRRRTTTATRKKTTTTRKKKPDASS
jgi:predicted regulator of Ras-like GTPase activity (Roadblock/LC7/MglB family)